MSFGPADDGRHTPGPDADERWQESWFLGWYDPSTRCGGFHHLGLQTKRGLADLWSWVAMDGQVVGKFQSLTLPLPDDDLSDLHLGGLHVVTKTPLEAYGVNAEYASGATASVTYEAFTPPFDYNLSADGTDLGSDHYESCGQVTGTISAGGRSIEANGFGFQDHSWGPRDWGSVLAHRWVFAVFGPDLFLSVMKFSTARGMVNRGYVHDQDGFHGVEALAYNAVVDDDGHSPLACDLHVDTVDGRHFRVEGEVDLSSVSSHNDNFFCTDGMSRFLLNGRQGAGIFEVDELGTPAPWHREQLGL